MYIRIDYNIFIFMCFWSDLNMNLSLSGNSVVDAPLNILFLEDMRRSE
jgi:hypothetical protein